MYTLFVLYAILKTLETAHNAHSAQEHNNMDDLHEQEAAKGIVPDAMYAVQLSKPQGAQDMTQDIQTKYSHIFCSLHTQTTGFLEGLYTGFAITQCPQEAQLVSNELKNRAVCVMANKLNDITNPKSL